MPASTSIPAAAWVVSAVFLTISLYVYGRACGYLLFRGGKVRSDLLGLPELLMSMVLAGFFGLMMAMQIQRQSSGGNEVKIDSVLPSSIIFVLITVVILCFLQFTRRLSVPRILGIDQVSPLSAIGWAIGLIVAAFPLTFAANVVTMQFMKNGFTPQPLIELFNKVARENDYLAIFKIFVAGVIIAPCCEEFLFRGFFYGVWKRYLGPLGAGVVACVLFAAFHTSLPAFGGLLILAICLNVAYERTGSLLVPIGMHALFNFTSLLVLYVQTRVPLVPAAP